MDSFYSNCVNADSDHLKDCDCCKQEVDNKLIEESKSFSKEIMTDNDELLKKLKLSRSDIIKNVGANNEANGVKCYKERKIVDEVVERFKSFDLSIPTYSLIVSSVINQVLLSYRLSNYIGANGLTKVIYDKFGNANEIVSPMIDMSSKVDRLIIDACEKMHRMKFGEKFVNENISTKPVSIDDLFKSSNAIIIEQKDENGKQ